MGTHRSKVAVAQPSGVSWVEIQFSQDLFVSRTKSGLSGDDYQFNPNVGLGYAGTFPDYSAIASVVQSRDFASPQGFPEGARPLVSCHFYDSFGSAQHAAHPILSQSACLAPGLVLCQGNPPLHQSFGPLENRGYASNRSIILKNVGDQSFAGLQ